MYANVSNITSSNQGNQGYIDKLLTKRYNYFFLLMYYFILLFLFIQGYHIMVHHQYILALNKPIITLP